MPTPTKENHGVRVRFPKGLHERLTEMADEQGTSMNTLIVTLLSGAIAYGPTKPQEADDASRIEF